jgi:hypothetical protein
MNEANCKGALLGFKHADNLQNAHNQDYTVLGTFPEYFMRMNFVSMNNSNRSQYSMKIPPFTTNHMRVLFITTYTALHVSAYLQVLSNNIIRVKLLIFLCGSTESQYSIIVVVCYIAKIQYNILRLYKVLKIPYK